MIVLRVSSFIGVLIAMLFLPLWIVVPIVCLYALVFTGYELLILAVCMDAQFGDMRHGIWYMYTLFVSVVLLCAIKIKPHLRFYN